MLVIVKCFNRNIKNFCNFKKMHMGINNMFGLNHFMFFYNLLRVNNVNHTSREILGFAFVCLFGWFLNVLVNY